MAEYFAFTTENSSGAGFGLLSVWHLLWLLSGAMFIFSMCIVYRRAGTEERIWLKRGLALSALFLELLRAALLMAAGRYGVGRLPLHLCGMAVYICAVHALRGGGKTGQFLYSFCMPGAAAALIFPDWSGYPSLHFMTCAGFGIHILLVAYVLTQAVSGGIAPDIRKAPACLGIMLALAVPVYLFDRLAGTNYMFLNWPSPGSPLEWFAFLGRPGYVLGYLPILGAVWAVIYYPFRRKKSADRQ